MTELRRQEEISSSKSLLNNPLGFYVAAEDRGKFQFTSSTFLKKIRKLSQEFHALLNAITDTLILYSPR
ncbi:MAG: hypothetical protein VR65_17500 [Desulfobulbaceae bacterium BRH_c16a]|nr:MAG: hypothetical protein VR65_17500 [Desulfobulbaceae bacterium BRH_c16a]